MLNKLSNLIGKIHSKLKGYGSCSRCACGGFEADINNNQVCSNCGHNYSDHW